MENNKIYSYVLVKSNSQDEQADFDGFNIDAPSKEIAVRILETLEGVHGKAKIGQYITSKSDILSGIFNGSEDDWFDAYLRGEVGEPYHI